MTSHRTKMITLKCPTTKMFVKDLARSKPENPDTSASNTSATTKTWKSSFSEGSLRFSSVWIQGTVVEVKEDGNQLIVDDGTGTATILICSKLPLKFAINEGMYVMAVGTFLSNGNQPAIKATKVQDVSACDQAQTMWPLEVLDQQAFLLKPEG